MEFFIVVILLFIILFIVISKYNTSEKEKQAQKAGNMGEKIVAETLKTLAEPKYIINNIMINDNGKSRQIDHIAITEQGIFVIETKNYTGTICGRETSTQWNEYLSGKSYCFKNPIHQNYGHVQIVKNILPEQEEKIFSVVVFIDKCKLKVYTNTPVLYHTQIKEYIENKQKILDQQIMETVYQTIEENKIKDKQAIQYHNENVKQYIQYKESVANKGICPRCNAALIIRHSKRGDFYGCSNFPKCNYTKNIEEVQKKE